MPALPSVARSILLPLFATPALAAQCAFSSVTTTAYGHGCNPVFANNQVAVSASLAVAACRLDVDVSAFPGCCNTFLLGRLLVIGLQPASQPLPLPPFAPGCTLLAAPDLLLFETNQQGSTFGLLLPPALQPPLTLYAQGHALYFTTIGLSYDWAISDGARLDLL